MKSKSQDKKSGRALEMIQPNSPGYGSVRRAAQYVGVSPRTFRDWLKGGLPHFRLSTGTILVAYRDIDNWLARFRVDENRADSLVDEILEDLT